MTATRDYPLTAFDPPGANRALTVIRRWHARAWAGGAPGSRTRKFAAVVVKLDRIGDFVLAVGAIRTVLERHGEANCALVLGAGAAELAAIEFPRATRVVLPPFVRHKRAWRDWRRARRALAGVACTELYCLRHQRWDYDELILTWIDAGRRHVLEDPQAPRWVAGRRSVRGPARPFVEQPDPGLGRELSLHGALLAEALGRTPTREEIWPRFARLGAGGTRRGIVILPFGSATIRDFPEPLLTEALRAAAARRPAAPLLLFGDASQRRRLGELAERLRARGLTGVDCAPPTSVAELAEAVARAELVLTAESAAAHLAAAFDRPALVVIGGGHYGQFGPWRRSARQVWITNTLECFGCDWRCVHPAPYCLTRIGVDAVRAGVAQALAEGGGP